MTAESPDDDGILTGERPINLPVQAPAKYKLVIDLTAAKAFGLKAPQQFQQLADKIIE